MKKSEAALVTINKGMNIDPKNPLCKFHRASILFSIDKHQVWILSANTLFSVLFFCYHHVVLIIVHRTIQSETNELLFETVLQVKALLRGEICCANNTTSNMPCHGKNHCVTS